MAMLFVVLASCATPSAKPCDARFSEQVVAEVMQLLDGWLDWRALLSATHVVEGVLRVEDRRDTIRDNRFTAVIESPCALLGALEHGNIVVEGHMYHRAQVYYRHYPVYAEDLQRANGRECVVFLYSYESRAWSIESSAVGAIKPIMTVADMEPRESQLESYLSLARRDAVRVARVVARHDTLVADIVARLRLAGGCEASVQSCFDDLGRLGDAAFPGVLHEMVKTLEIPEANHIVDSIIYTNPASRGYGVRVADTFEFMNVFTSVHLGVHRASYGSAEDRSRVVRALAAELIARRLHRQDPKA